MEKMIIRKGKIEDALDIKKLFIELGIDQLSKDKYYKYKMPDNDIDVKEIVEALNNKNAIIFVAELSNKIIGYIEAYITEPDYYFFCDRYVYILHAFVDKKFRGFNIMRELHLNVEEWAKKNEVKYVEADVFYHNIVAKEILDYLGYEGYRTRYVKTLK